MSDPVSTDMVSVIAEVLAEHQLAMGTNRLGGNNTALCVCAYRTEGIAIFTNLHAAHQARAVLAAISEAGNVEWGVAGPNGYVNEYETEADARLQIATRNYLTLWNRFAATEWEVAE